MKLDVWRVHRPWCAHESLHGANGISLWPKLACLPEANDLFTVLSVSGLFKHQPSPGNFIETDVKSWTWKDCSLASSMQALQLGLVLMLAFEPGLFAEEQRLGP